MRRGPTGEDLLGALKGMGDSLKPVCVIYNDGAPGLPAMRIPMNLKALLTALLAAIVAACGVLSTNPDTGETEIKLSDLRRTLQDTHDGVVEFRLRHGALLPETIDTIEAVEFALLDVIDEVELAMTEGDYAGMTRSIDLLLASLSAISDDLLGDESSASTLRFYIAAAREAVAVAQVIVPAAEAPQ